MATSPGDVMRTAALLDLENLLATVVYEPDGGALRLWTSEELWCAADRVLGVLEAAQVEWAVAVVHASMATALVGHPLTRAVRVHVHRGGRDAADHALIARARQVPRRFPHVIVGSGDHEFVPLVERLRARSRLVTVLSLPSCRSRLLAAAADGTLDLAV